ncbi:hypothetical protein VUR80DRAFT_6247 [Thermomyces stellatus]
MQSGPSTNSGQVLNFDTSDAGSQSRFSALQRTLMPQEAEETSVQRLPDSVRDENSINKSMPSSIHLAPAFPDQNSDSHATRHDQTEALSVGTHCQHGSFSFPLHPNLIMSRGGLVPHGREHPKRPCCHLRLNQISPSTTEEWRPTPVSEGTYMLVPVIVVGQEPTTRRLMRLVGPHASMTTPVAHGCGADLGAAGRI